MPSHFLFLQLFPQNRDILFSTHFSLSVRQGTFYDQPQLYLPRPMPSSIVHSLILLNLELTFLAHMICDHAVIYKVSSAPLPRLSFFFSFFPGCGQVICWVIKAAGGWCSRGSVYPAAQL